MRLSVRRLWAGQPKGEPVDTFGTTDVLKYANLYRHKMGTVVIPEKLRSDLTHLLRGYSRTSLAQNTAVLADLLRRRVRARPSDASAGIIKPKVMVRYDYDETQTYLAHRVPGIFATAFRVLREVSFKLPNFVPRSMLDFGSGPGTAVLAAVRVWPAMQECVAIEPSESMEKASTRLLGTIPDLTVTRHRHLVDFGEKPHDMVVASYSLGELQDPVDREAIVKQLWSLVEQGGLLVLIEPGSPVGFKSIRDARDTVLAAGATMIAPCPHAHVCPMPSTKWCHFKQRIRKTPLQMQTKMNKAVNYADEKYSYLVASKGLVDESPLPEDSNRHRIVRQPGKKGGHVLLETCSDQGVYETITVAKSHGKDVYRAARKAFWGDEILVPLRSQRSEGAENAANKKK